MGSLGDCTWILGLTDYRVVELTRDDNGRLVIDIERRGIRRYVCSGCGRRTGRVRDAKVRTWDDLPWAERPVALRYPLRRLHVTGYLGCGGGRDRYGRCDPRAVRLDFRCRRPNGLGRRAT